MSGELAIENGDDAVTWSVMIPTYLPGAFLLETLRSVLDARAEIASRIQIQVVDDHSPGFTLAEQMRRWGLDASGIEIFQRDTNGGLAACWNTCIERATGHFVHILHQDDLVDRHFYRRMEEVAEIYPEASMLFCRNIFLLDGKKELSVLIQEKTGPIRNWLETIVSGQKLQCPAVVVRRSTYKLLGGFDPRLRYVIDWEMWIRIAAGSTVIYIPEPLASYRVHSGAETQRLKAAGKIVPDLIEGMRRIRRTLLKASRPDCIAVSMRHAWDFCAIAADEAQRLGKYQFASRALRASIFHFGYYAGLKKTFGRIRWYFSLRRKQLLKTLARN